MQGSDEQIKELTAKLLIALGVHVKNGQITLHMDADGMVQQVETKTFRKLRPAGVPERRQGDRRAATF